MSRLTSKIQAGLLALALPTAASAAPNDLTMGFANCAGRLSATMEFEWLLGQDGETARAERDAMVSLLEAVMAPEDARDTLARRIEAKYAHSVLLTRAHFNDDAQDAAWAADRAEVEIGSCRALILS
ncbi:hypothetical protein [Maritimibacter sp. DP1N21-5]|uniref:hypothetical protein n=1 Tax=Maritimibacter sp. DP1N21-5 TaxID=2836867 RepID=UPI001C4973C6|nr:hypothetical protein [Maritimibacter sp. DP1N21-5]MBV7409385.1 hypothetical protein [Maritimibacter sp. DP1N21-5]